MSPDKPAEIPAAVRRALAAIDALDNDAFVAAFAEDGYVDDWGREFRGPDAVRGWSDAEFIGVRVSLDVTEVEERDGAVTVTAQVGGDGFNGPSHFTFDVAGDRVSRMTIRA